MQIIVNPNAGAKAGFSTNPFGLAAVEAAVVEAGLPCEIVATSGPGDATALARAAVAAGHEVVVAAGGDGTVREVATALIGTRAVLGILPLGSAMNVAHVLDIPRDLRAATALLRAAERVEPIDIGRVHGKLFIETAGAGITAGVLHLLGQIDAGRWRRLSTLVRYVRLARVHRLLVEADGRRIAYRTLSILVANAPMAGAAVTVAPGALMNDGLATVRIFRAVTKVDLARSWLRIILGRSPAPLDTVDLEASRITVQSRRPQLVHADDELAGSTPAVFEIVPGAISVLVGPHPIALDGAAAGQVALDTA